jgi:flagellar hook-associated protein 3
MSFSFDGLYRATSYALEQQATAMALLQEQVATGSQINRTSDNPSDANRVMSLNSNSTKLAYFTEEMDEFSGMLNVTSSLMSMMSEQLTGFKAGLTAALSMGDDRKAALALGIDDLLEALVSLANTDRKGQKIFGGADSASVPYVVERSNGKITNVIYQGSTEDRKIEVAPNVELSSVFIGDKMFKEDSRQDVEFITNETGALVGSGTSNVDGYFELEVTKPGADYLLSIDGGVTTVTVPAIGEANTAVTDPKTGKVLYVDTRNLTAPGTVTANVPGTHDVFNLLINIRDQLQAANSKQELSALAESLSSVHTKLVTGFSIIGGRASTLGVMRDGYENVQFNAKEEIARLQDADIAQIAVDLTRRETLYQMSMGIAGKLLSTSLMDFL